MDHIYRVKNIAVEKNTEMLHESQLSASVWSPCLCTRLGDRDLTARPLVASMAWISGDLWPRVRLPDSVKAQRVTLSITFAVSDSKILNICKQHENNCSVGHEG